MNALELKVPPPLVMLAIGAAMWGLSPAVTHGLVTNAIALAISLAGGIVAAAGALAFRRVKTTVSPLKPQSASSLVTGGIYRVTRNPMYVGLLLVLVAWAAFLVDPWSLWGPVAFVAYITRFQIKPEERALQNLFGDEFLAYTAKVRRWL